MAQKTPTRALYQPGGGGVGREMGGSFVLRSDKKQQNSVKQLSFNKKILKKKGMKLGSRKTETEE